MTVTAPKVSFGLYDLEINNDSTPACTDVQSFSKVMDLKTGNATTYPIATYEPDFWLLDGKYKFIQEVAAAVHVGLMSLSMSDANGDFATAPVLTVDFDQVHTTDGLILHFAQQSNDYADSITVTYYDIYGEVICTDNYSPDSWEYEIDKDVVDFKQIVITFHGTNKPYRYLRLTAIDYGQLIFFTGTAIKQASVVEEIDMLSATVPANSCDLRLYSTDSQFSIVNPTGYYARLSDRQPLSVYETINGNQIFMGRYYLDVWKNVSNTEIEFKCLDAIGVLDRIQYHGGLWKYEGIKAQYLIDEIMNVAQFPYDLDAELYDVMVMGWIKACSCREALQQVAFAIGAYIDCSRSNLVKIRPSIILDGTEATIHITSAQKGASQSLEQKTLVTGVEITSHNYQEGAETVNLYSGTLAAGFYDIPFSQPVHTLAITGAVIVSSSVNSARIRVTEAGSVTLTGLNYIDNQQLFSSTGSFGSYVIPNIVKIDSATLVNAYNGQTVADRVYDYYQQRYLQKLKLFAHDTIKTGSVALIDSINDSQIRACVEKMSINLAGGFIIEAAAVGIVE